MRVVAVMYERSLKILRGSFASAVPLVGSVLPGSNVISFQWYACDACSCQRGRTCADTVVSTPRESAFSMFARVIGGTGANFLRAQIVVAIHVSRQSSDSRSRNCRRYPASYAMTVSDLKSSDPVRSRFGVFGMRIRRSVSKRVGTRTAREMAPHALWLRGAPAAAHRWLYLEPGELVASRIWIRPSGIHRVRWRFHLAQTR